MNTAEMNARNGYNLKPVPAMKIEAFTGDVNVYPGEIIADQNVSAIDTLIESCKIDLSEVLSPPPIAMQIMREGAPITLFTKGNFSIVTGAAKSRKTFLLSMLMAAAIKGSFQDLFLCPHSGVNVVFDTEQSRYKAQQIAKRMCWLSEQTNPENLQVFSLRTLDPSQRLDLIDKVLANTPGLNFVAIDGIIDLDIDPILQADQAQKIVSKLMKWTEMYNIHIVCVLHYNKTVATLLGHLGSFSHRKADAIIEVSKSKDDENISLVKAVDCREKEFLPFAFSVDQNGMPFIQEGYVFEKTSKERKTSIVKPPAISPGNIEPSAHSEILDLVFNTQREQGYNELWRNIKSAIESITGQAVGDNKAKDFSTYYTTNERIIKTEIPNRKPVYTIAGQGAMRL